MGNGEGEKNRVKLGKLGVLQKVYGPLGPHREYMHMNHKSYTFIKILPTKKISLLLMLVMLMLGTLNFKRFFFF